jgi:hypothetical protein
LVELEPSPEGFSPDDPWGADGLVAVGAAVSAPCFCALSSLAAGEVERVPIGALFASSAGTVAVLPPAVGEAGGPERGAFGESSVLPGVGCGAALLPMPVGLEVVLPEGGAAVCARAAAAMQRDATKMKGVLMKSSSFESGAFKGADRRTQEQLRGGGLPGARTAQKAHGGAGRGALLLRLDFG